MYIFNGNEGDLSLFTCDRHSLRQEEKALIRRRTELKDIQDKSKRDREEKLLEDEEERLKRNLDLEEAQLKKRAKKWTSSERKQSWRKLGQWRKDRKKICSPRCWQFWEANFR